MNIAELQNEVINRMRRPDLVDLIKSRVIGTIKQLHGSGYYARDRVEEVIKIGNPSCTTKLTIPPYWRRFVALVPFTESGTTNIPLRRTDHQDFELSDVSALWQTDDNINTYYVSFNTVTIKSEVAFAKLYACYFKYPDLRDLTVTTWVTEHYEQLVIDYTLAAIYTAIGNKDLADTHKILASDLYKQFLVNSEAEGVY